jgi:hypothetical protein
MSNSRETPPPSSGVFVRRQKVAPQPSANDPLDFLQVNAQANARPTSRHPSVADQPLPPPPLPLRNVAAAFASASQTLAYCVAAGTPSGDMPCMTLLNIISHDALSSISCRLKPQRSSPSASPQPAIQPISALHLSIAVSLLSHLSDSPHHHSFIMRLWVLCHLLVTCAKICQTRPQPPAKTPAAGPIAPLQMKSSASYTVTAEPLLRVKCIETKERARVTRCSHTFPPLLLPWLRHLLLPQESQFPLCRL